MSQVYTGARAAKTEDRVWPWDTLRPEAVSEWGRGNHYWYLHGQCIRGSLNLCLWLDHHSLYPSLAKSSHRPLLFQHCSPLGQGYWCWERGKHTFEGNRANLDLTLRSSAPATWDLPLLLIRW